METPVDAMPRLLALKSPDPAPRLAQARDAERSATVQSLTGSGGRTDRVRTYNFPQVCDKVDALAAQIR